MNPACLLSPIASARLSGRFFSCFVVVFLLTCTFKSCRVVVVWGGGGSTVRCVTLMFVWVRTVGLGILFLINMQGKGAEAQRAGGGGSGGGEGAGGGEEEVQFPPNTGYG